MRAIVYSLAGKVLDDQASRTFTLASQQVRTGVLKPRVPSGSPTRVYFVELQLRQHWALVDRNVYWLSTHQDVVNYAKTLGQPNGILRQYTRLKALQGLPGARVSVTAATERRPAPDGADLATMVTIATPRRRRSRCSGDHGRSGPSQGPDRP